MVYHRTNFTFFPHFQNTNSRLPINYQIGKRLCIYKSVQAHTRCKCIEQRKIPIQRHCPFQMPNPVRIKSFEILCALFLLRRTIPVTLFLIYVGTSIRIIIKCVHPLVTYGTHCFKHKIHVHKKVLHMPIAASVKTNT